MSTRPGQHVKKKPAQKHQNSHTYKFDKYRTDPTAKVLKGLQVVNCCPKCTQVIEWKIKYGKYKPLTVPGKCVECLQKTVKHSYHIRCVPCVLKVKKCAKCGQNVSSCMERLSIRKVKSSKVRPPWWGDKHKCNLYAGKGDNHVCIQ